MLIVRLDQEAKSMQRQKGGNEISQRHDTSILSNDADTLNRWKEEFEKICKVFSFIARGGFSIGSSIMHQSLKSLLSIS